MALSAITGGCSPIPPRDCLRAALALLDELLEVEADPERHHHLQQVGLLVEEALERIGGNTPLVSA